MLKELPELWSGAPYESRVSVYWLFDSKGIVYWTYESLIVSTGALFFSSGALYVSGTYAAEYCPLGGRPYSSTGVGGGPYSSTTVGGGYGSLISGLL